MIPDLLVAALAFYREPARFPQLRDVAAPLPAGLTDLLAATTSLLSDEQITATAAALNATEGECRDSVSFFLKQVMLDADGDYYRILGVAPDAPAELIKRHYQYLIRIFHPDKGLASDSWDDVYAPRINEAYNTLRNEAKRNAYDAALTATDRPRADAARQPATTGPAPAAPRGRAAYATSTAGFSARAKQATVLGLVLVLVFLAQLLYRQNQKPNLRVATADTGSESIAEADITMPRQDLSGQHGAVRFNDQPLVAVAVSARTAQAAPALESQPALALESQPAPAS
ncbi:J domain-containing protein, partial [Halioglobus sp.]|nr:J domain-containing protein [Halioglobus sp.]